MFKHILIVFFVSMVPLLELRGAIPYGVVYGLPLWLTFVVAIVGNMFPVPDCRVPGHQLFHLLMGRRFAQIGQHTQHQQ